MRNEIKYNKRISIQLLFWMLSGLIFLTGCTDEQFGSGQGKPVDQSGVPEGFVRGRVNMVVSGFEVVQTRSLDHEQEHVWTHVVVGQFDKDNNLVETSVQRYLYGTSGEFNVILQESQGEENTIYFILNYGESGGDMTDADNNPFINPETGVLVSDLEEFKSQVYRPATISNEGISERDQLAMVGSLQTVVDAELISISTMLVYVDKLTAKLDVRINAAKSIAMPDHPFNASTLTITGLTIMNVPRHAAFATDGEQITDPADVTSVITVLTEKDENLAKVYTTEESYYILENRMHADEQPLYPTNSAERGQEQFKNHAARDNGIDGVASYLLIKGTMNDGRNVGDVTWQIYLGENNVDNFNIKRNTHYTVTVKIDGAGIATSDVRVNKEDLHVRELRFLNSRYASGRSPETSYLTATEKNWGNKSTPAAVASTDYLYMDAGDGTWGFELTNTNGTPITDWPGLSVSYLPLAEPGATDPGTVVGMNENLIRAKWKADDIENNWITVPGMSASGLPSGVRVRINVGTNWVPSDRTVEFRYFNTAKPDIIRAWRVNQTASEVITVLDRHFVPSSAGTYGIMIRGSENSYWKLQSVSGSVFSFGGAADSDGDVTQTSLTDGYVKGHGTILFNVSAYSGVPYRTATMVVRTFDGDPGANPDATYFDKTITVYQMGSMQNFVATKNRSSGRYVYDYSSDPLFETLFALPYGIPIGINLVDDGMDYNVDESLYEAWSTSDGKANTLKIFKKLEGYVAEQTTGNLSLTAPPVFSPAGLCMMMNEEWWEINDVDDPRYEWYLPARYPGLMDATSVMLGVAGIGSSGINAFWTSTVPRTKPSQVRSSAYFAGTTVDVSSNFSATSTVRCVRDNKTVTKSYPYLTQDQTGNPVVVTYEEVGDVPKGYTRIQTSTNASHAVYKLGKPLRFTEPGQVASDRGLGPSDPNWAYLSPKFRVAKQDAVVAGSSRTDTWVVASGWKDANASDLPAIATGCAAYEEDGGGWRVPSELEMRLILLLGGGYGSSPSSTAEVSAVQKGGKSFSDFTSSGFTYLGTSSGRSYWTNRKYPNDNRVVYLRASGGWESPIYGTAVAWNENYYVRCVRDL